MALRVITACLKGSSSDTAVLDGALSLSRLFGGHIDALLARPDPRLAVVALGDGIYPGVYNDMISMMERQWADVANKALKNFEKWRAANNLRVLTATDQANGPSVEWRDAAGAETEILGRRGRLSDIVVTAMRARRSDARDDLGFDPALLEIGRPVLLIPPSNHTDPTKGTVVIAWNGSVEAYRAVTAALPLLTKSQDVLIFSAVDESDQPIMANELMAYLNWHGIQASVLAAEKNNTNSVEEALLATVKKSKASLLVMGAYTHSRLRQSLFGGVTRHVLQNATIPVLMAH